MPKRGLDERTSSASPDYSRDYGRGESLSGRGQWACTLRRTADLISAAMIEEKRELVPSTPQVGVTL